MDVLAVVVSLVALILASMAFARTGGLGDVRRQLDSLSTKTEGTRDLAANAIGKLEGLVRGSDKPKSEPPESRASDRNEVS